MFPILFHVFGFPVSSFGVMLALAFLVGGLLAALSFEKAGLRRDDAWKLVTWCMVGGVLGAKLWYVGEQFARGTESTLLELVFSRGGLTWFGGLAGGAIAGVLGARSAGVPIATGLECAAPTVAVAQAIGRIGCLLVGDDYGRTTDVPWGIAFPEGLPPTTQPVHPTMVYETLWLLPAGLWLWQRRGISPFLFGEYLVLAGAGRLWIEALRTNPALLGPLSNAQLVSLAMLAVGAAGWIRAARRRRLTQGARS